MISGLQKPNGNVLLSGSRSRQAEAPSSGLKQTGGADQFQGWTAQPSHAVRPSSVQFGILHGPKTFDLEFEVPATLERALQDLRQNRGNTAANIIWGGINQLSQLEKKRRGGRSYWKFALIQEAEPPKGFKSGQYRVERIADRAPGYSREATTTRHITLDIEQTAFLLKLARKIGRRPEQLCLDSIYFQHQALEKRREFANHQSKEMRYPGWALGMTFHYSDGKLGDILTFSE